MGASGQIFSVMVEARGHSSRKLLLSHRRDPAIAVAKLQEMDINRKILFIARRDAVDWVARPGECDDGFEDQNQA